MTAEEVRGEEESSEGGESQGPLGPGGGWSCSVLSTSCFNPPREKVRRPRKKRKSSIPDKQTGARAGKTGLKGSREKRVGWVKLRGTAAGEGNESRRLDGNGEGKIVTRKAGKAIAFLQGVRRESQRTGGRSVHRAGKKEGGRFGV